MAAAACIRISAWGGFEKLVAKLHETGTVTVKHDVTLTGQSGAPRKIDVLIRHAEGLSGILVIAVQLACDVVLYG